MSVLVGGEKRSVFNWHLKCQQKFFEKSKSDVRARARYRFAMTWFLRAETLRWRAERFWSFIVAPKWFFFTFFFVKLKSHTKLCTIERNWFPPIDFDTDIGSKHKTNYFSQSRANERSATRVNGLQINLPGRWSQGGMKGQISRQQCFASLWA